MSSTQSSTPSSLTDFTNAVKKLEANSLNWVIFECRFIIAVKQKQVYGHFDGSSPSPVKTNVMTNTAFVDAQNTWQEKEDTALYLLSQKLPNSIFSKYWWKATIAEMWSAICTEFTQKSMVMHSNLHSEFMAMRYKKGADLQMEFDCIRMKHKELLNAGITVSDDAYCMLIINFVPGEISSFIAQISAGMRALSLIQQMSSSTQPIPSPNDNPAATNSNLKLDLEMLMQMAIKEWEHHQGNKKSNKGKDRQTGTDGAFATVASEKPGSRTGGSCGRHGRGPRQPVGECWNCSGKGHRMDTCLSPKKDNKDKGGEKKDDKSKMKQHSPLMNHASSSMNTSLTSSAPSPNPPPYTKQPSANAATDVSSAWSAFGDTLPVAETTFEAADDLEEMDDVDEYEFEWLHKARSAFGLHTYLSCFGWRLEYNDNVSPVPTPNLPPSLALLPALDMSEIHILTTAHALAVETSSPAHPIWDLYDSGVSHHMSPCHGDFVNFCEIAPHPLTAVNQQAFMAHGIGDLIITMLKGSDSTRWRLHGTLYTPTLGFTLVSIG